MQAPLVGELEVPPCVRSVKFNGRPNSGLRITGARRSFVTLWAAICGFFMVVGVFGFVAVGASDVGKRWFGGAWLCVGVLLIVGERCERARRKDADIVVGRWFIACSQRPRSYRIGDVEEVARVSTNVEVTLVDGRRELFFRGRQVDVAEFVANWTRERMWADSMV
ncbi:hypothetical protein BSKO_07546 [Bryopsis sp. KO-2023]|nr:hypothetical protein BSKO_07546 [Bryopsis sp. KO-2023]